MMKVRKLFETQSLGESSKITAFNDKIANIANYGKMNWNEVRCVCVFMVYSIFAQTSSFICRMRYTFYLCI